MKKKLLLLLFATILLSGFSDLYINTADAEAITVEPTVTPTPEPTVTPIPTVNMISINQLPSKITYSKGESLDFSDMIVQAYYADGTTNFVTDYEVIGYNSEQIGSQTLAVIYQNQIASLTIMVLPPKVTNITVSSYDRGSFTLTWDANRNASRYEVYCLNDVTGTYDLCTNTYTNSVTLYYPTGSAESFKICSVENILGLEYKSVMSDVILAATSPDIVTGLVVAGTGTNSISLSWNVVSGATGYLIYRSDATQENYVVCGTSTTTTFVSNNLTSGKGYKYKVVAYNFSEAFTGGGSNIVDTSTNPSKMILKYKQGEEKVRLSWKKINGATSYDIYISDQMGGYMLLTSFTGNKTFSYIAEELSIGNTYSFYAVAHRNYNGLVYDSPASELITIDMEPIDPTSTDGKLFPTEQDFYDSWVYNSLDFFKKYVNYNKSYAIPGLTTTNVNGFSSTTMCPQALTFAGDYLLMSAYDLAAEENSVIYVLDKTTKELLTTLVLSSKPHVGGLAFDGTYVWVTNGSKVSSISFEDIEAAAVEGLPYVNVDYSAVCPLDIVTSFITYYDDKLWVGTYDELQTTNLYSYQIDYEDSIPDLIQVDTIVMPTRVQGIAFSSKGTMFISRSCQLYKGLRGYMRQIDVYKPQFSKEENGVIPLGKIVNSVSMPSMNEGITINGEYLYVTFESGAFKKSTYRMDRICAFKMVNIVKKKG